MPLLGSNFALAECRANLHAATALLSPLIFYLVLVLRLAADFRSSSADWRPALAMHIYAHLVADLVELLPFQVIVVLLLSGVIAVLPLYYYIAVDVVARCYVPIVGM